MKPEIIIILSIFVVFACIEQIKGSFWFKRGQRRKDAVVEVVSTGVVSLITQPVILLISWALMQALFPQWEGSLTNIAVFWHILLLLVFDDMMQYWLHRASHTYPWLYNLHRAHHDAPYMSIRLVYRNHLCYYFFMPSLWFSGILIYLGLGYTYAVYLVVKMLVITGAHSDVAWDKSLYQVRWLAPVMWVVERTISTPSTHSAHHGRHAEDGVTHYKGNFGNLLFFWDVLFGTAKITRRYPTEYGVENLEPVSSGKQLIWPLVRK